jgi:hypothetical protein
MRKRPAFGRIVILNHRLTGVQPMTPSWVSSSTGSKYGRSPVMFSPLVR